MSDATNTLELGNYRVLHREDGTLWTLGKGSYGTTYKGEHKHLRRICALKVINDHLVRNDQAKLRFLQEAQAAASLDHEHIARIYDFGEADGLFYYAMTYCGGGDLEEYASRNGAQNWAVVKELARQILRALGKAHDEGLLHRDLKPSNVMLATADDLASLRLIDFGLVKALDPGDPSETAQMRTQEGSFMGNPLTASPEQFREEDLDERSDLFSVGITLWYLLMGGSPFGKTSAAQIAQQRLTVTGYDNLLPSGLDPEARWILNRLLATDRNERFRSAKEVLAALDGVEVESGSAPAQADAGVPKENDYDDLWALGGHVRQFEYGSYFVCSHKTNPEVPPSSMFIPEPQGPSFAKVTEGADRLSGQRVPQLCAYFSRGLMDGERAYLCESLPTGSYQTLLQEAGRLTLKEDGVFLAQVAEALDGALALGLPGLEMGDTEVLIGVDPALGLRPIGEDQWREYLQNGARVDGSRTAGLRVTLLPRLGDEGTHREASATIGGDDLATNPVARFGAFLYRALSGMSVKQSGYLTALNHISFSDISEDSNRYLSEVIAAVLEPASAWEVLQRLCDFEGCTVGGHRPDAAASHGMPDPSVTMSAPVRPVAPPVVPMAASASATTPLVSAAQMATALPPSASAPMPSPPVTGEPARAAVSKVGKKSKGPALLLGVVVLALAGGGYYFYTERQNRVVDDGSLVELPQETGDGELSLENFSIVGGNPDGVPLALGDANGVAVGSFESGGDGATIKKFPLAVFEESDRWPLRFVSLDSRYLVDGPKLEKSDIKGRDGSKPVCREKLNLKVSQFLDVVPEISAGGESFDDILILSRYIEPELDSVDFKVSPHQGGLRVVLDSGGSFPVTASLRVPGAKPAELVLSRDSTPSAELLMRERDLKIAGLASGMTLRFEPDLSQVDDESLREIYEVLGGTRTTGSRDVMANEDAWTLPWIPGSIVLEKGGRGGRVLIAYDSEYMVLADLTNRLEVEDTETGRLRDFAQRGGLVDMYRLAMRYYGEHEGQEADALAYGWMRLAAERGDAPSQYSLGCMYRDGTGVQRNQRDMVRWFRKSAENGHPGGMNHYGLCYRGGTGVKQDDQKAEEWFKKSADERDSFAMNNLGLLYGDDESDLYDPAKSLEWLVKASEAGSVKATFNLAFSYHNGIGVPVDLEKAKELYQSAADSGHEQAKLALKQLGN